LKSKRQPRTARTSWDHLTTWYDGWVGSSGSDHHRQLAIPTVLDLLALRPGERLLDLGCGQGALAAAVERLGVSYTGVDISERMLQRGRRMHRKATFVHGDATDLDGVVDGRSFDAATFLLSIQNIDPLNDAIAGAAWAVKPRGRLVILMTHPCFRVPRQSGWGWDADRRLTFRRVDRYLQPLAVPLKPLRNKAPVLSFHRPLEEYAAALGQSGFVIEALREVAADEPSVAGRETPNLDIPLFLGLRARLVGRAR
jgi:ubiquinone/menaquinone biosynthesis C-methylase UbiE